MDNITSGEAAWLQQCYMCANSGAMSVPMLLAPAHYSRLSLCAVQETHERLKRGVGGGGGGGRSVQSPNDAALHRARPLLPSLVSVY